MYNLPEPNQKPTDARREIVKGIGILSLIAIILGTLRFPFPRKKNIIACKPEPNSKKITMLTQDGRLVEIDESLLTSGKKKITNQELQHWIKK